MSICGGIDWAQRRIQRCPTENRRRRMVVWGTAWYSPTWTCLGCGDRWTDGERDERPFERGWRRKAIAEAAEMWTNIERYPTWMGRTR